MEKVIIAGPCSAESETQMLTTARKIKEISSSVLFRAGIWKPRTKPGSFEGMGEQGLVWLKKVKDDLGLRIATEVANAGHVELALKYGVDVLWIGARSTVNPFSVQEIADALKGSNATVYIKNPTHPELALWEGAVERIEKSGIKDIGLIHRGFKTHDHSSYRNNPLWQIPIEMKVRHPQYPMICDVSHIVGKRDGLLDVASKAATLDYQGLMIETHINPEVALSDAQQQITPDALKELLSKVEWKVPSLNTSVQDKLKMLREQINLLDDEIMQMLGARMKVAEDIGRLKKENNMPILQPNRFQEIINENVAKGKKHGLSEEFIVHFLDAIHIESINKQNQVIFDRKLT
jgi:chorismate mutase